MWLQTCTIFFLLWNTNKGIFKDIWLFELFENDFGLFLLFDFHCMDKKKTLFPLLCSTEENLQVLEWHEVE